MLEQREAEDRAKRAKIEWLRGAAQEGMDAIGRGAYVTLNSSAEITGHLHGLRARK